MFGTFTTSSFLNPRKWLFLGFTQKSCEHSTDILQANDSRVADSCLVTRPANQAPLAFI